MAASTRATSAAATVSSPQTQDSSVARKRRFEKLTHKSASHGPVTDVNISAPAAAVPPKKRKVSTDQTTPTTVKSAKQAAESSPKKEKIVAKPKICSSAKQMRYDPEVPMSKEEASAWRREQRRLRNRESAAASRQKTRDRIAELEIEVDEWRIKYAELERKYKLHVGAQSQGSLLLSQPKEQGLVSPAISPPSSPHVSPVSPDTTLSSATLLEYQAESVHEDRNQHLIETISRPA